MSTSHRPLAIRLLAISTGAALCVVAIALAPRVAAWPAEEPIAWHTVESPDSIGAVTALDAVSDDDVWMATIRNTSGASIYRRQNGPWEEQVYYDNRGIDDMVMLSADEGWFVGYDFSVSSFSFRPLAVHYRSGTFDVKLVQPEGWLFGVDAVAWDAVWAVGGQGMGPGGEFTKGMVLRWQNDQWRTEATVDGQALVDIDMVTADEGWAVGTRGALLHYAAGRWTPVEAPTKTSDLRLSGIQMLSGSEGWAVGDASRLLHHRAGAWEVVATDLKGSLRHVRPLSPTDAWAVGTTGEAPLGEVSPGVIARLRDGAWAAVTPPAGTGSLYALDMLGPELGWAGGEALGENVVAPGLVLRYGPPLPTPTPTATPEGIAVYEGLYGSSFEVSSFVTGTLRCPQYGAGWWLGANEAFWKRYEEIYPDAGRSVTDTLKVYTRFRGVLSPPGNYGHLGQYRHAIRVIELLDMVKVTRCPLPDFTPPPTTPGTPVPPTEAAKTGTPTVRTTPATRTGTPTVERPVVPLYLPRVVWDAGGG